MVLSRSGTARLRGVGQRVGAYEEITETDEVTDSKIYPVLSDRDCGQRRCRICRGVLYQAERAGNGRNHGSRDPRGESVNERREGRRREVGGQRYRLRREHCAVYSGRCYARKKVCHSYRGGHVAVSLVFESVAACKRLVEQAPERQSFLFERYRSAARRYFRRVDFRAWHRDRRPCGGEHGRYRRSAAHLK